ncbi:MAG: hypothetical protein M0P13_07045, partial [Fibrobacteraceae bacterium]|nr:hypothetical protein [Fibrobacteraceae bacterium]
AVVLVLLPQGKLQAFIFLRHIRMPVQIVAEIYLVGIARTPQMQVKHPLRETRFRISLVERHPFAGLRHAQRAAPEKDLLRAFHREAGPEFHEHVDGGLRPYPAHRRAPYVMNAALPRRGKRTQHGSGFLGVPGIPAIIARSQNYGKKFPQFPERHFGQGLRHHRKNKTSPRAFTLNSAERNPPEGPVIYI